MNTRAPDESTWTRLRRRMVEEQLVSRGIDDSRVLDVMMRVPRHAFVPDKHRSSSYDDRPLPLGPEQTISQPYIVAYMLEQLDLKPQDRVLEVGTGSGYQAALLSELCAEVFSIDIDPRLIQTAAEHIRSLGFQHIHLKAGDGALGWREESPFDKIIVAAACPTVPRELVRQLRDGGKLVLPLGEEGQTLILFEKERGELRSSELGPVRFVPLQVPQDQ